MTSSLVNMQSSADLSTAEGVLDLFHEQTRMFERERLDLEYRACQRVFPARAKLETALDEAEDAEGALAEALLQVPLALKNLKRKQASVTEALHQERRATAIANEVYALTEPESGYEKKQDWLKRRRGMRTKGFKYLCTFDACITAEEERTLIYSAVEVEGLDITVHTLLDCSADDISARLEKLKALGSYSQVMRAAKESYYALYANMEQKHQFHEEALLMCHGMVPDSPWFTRSDTFKEQDVALRPPHPNKRARITAFFQPK